MMRIWMLVTEHNSHFEDSETVEMPDYLPVTIYADTTGQYSEEEIEEMMERDFWGQMIDIPVPEDLLFQWWLDDLDNNRLHLGKHAWQTGDYEEFQRWFHEESTADDTETLYHWLVAHNYNWKRLN